MQRADRLQTIFVLLLSLVGTAALFLPFIADVSPWRAVSRPPFFSPWWIFLLAAPFFLSIPVLAWQARRLFADRLTTAEIFFAYLLATAAMLATAVWLGLLTFGLAQDLILGNFPRHTGEQLFGVALVPSWLLMFVNVLQLLRNRRAKLSREATAEAFLLGAYLPNAVFCLVAFHRADPLLVSGLEVGAYLIALVSLGYLAAIFLLSRQKPTGTPA